VQDMADSIRLPSFYFMTDNYFCRSLGLLGPKASDSEAASCDVYGKQTSVS
jgi:hypothetical protein